MPSVTTPSFFPGRGISNIADIHQEENIIYNNTIFITTSDIFQKAHEFDINISSNGLYKFSWFNVWENNNLNIINKNMIDIKIEIDNNINFSFEKIGEIFCGSGLLLLSQGNHNIIFYIRSKNLGQEIKLIRTRLEYNRIYN